MKTSIPKIFNFEKIEVFIIIMWPKFFQRSPSRDDFVKRSGWSFFFLVAALFTAPSRFIHKWSPPLGGSLGAF